MGVISNMVKVYVIVDNFGPHKKGKELEMHKTTADALIVNKKVSYKAKETKEIKSKK